MNFKTYTVSIFILFGWICAVFSQVGEESNEVQVDSAIVNIFSDKEKSDNSSFKRKKNAKLLLNLILPGSGEIIYGNKNKGIFYLLTDMTIFSMAVFLESHSVSLYNDSRAYASLNAGVNTKKDPGDPFWKIIGEENFLSVKDYNNAMELETTTDKKYIDESDFWQWNSDETQKEYRNMRDKAAKYHIAFSFMIGSAILNRVISFVDSRISSKGYRTSLKNRDRNFYCNFAYEPYSEKSNIKFTCITNF